MNVDLRLPWGITFHPLHQQVIVTDTHPRRVHIFRRQQTHQQQFQHQSVLIEAQLNDTSGVCVQPHTENILVCGDVNSHVHVFSPSLQSSSSQVYLQSLYAIGSGIPVPTAPFSRFRQFSNRRFDKPLGICCTPNGSIAVVEYAQHRMQIFDASGRFISTFGSCGNSPHQFLYPRDVCYLHPHFSPSSSASSLLLIADNSNAHISIWNLSSGPGRDRHIRNIKLEGYPRGICVDMNGLVYLSFYSSIRVLDPRNDFQLLQRIGTDSVGAEPGAFSDATGLCVDDTNTLMVVDRGNHRVQFFD